MPQPRLSCWTSTIALSRTDVHEALAALEAPSTSCSVVPAFEGGRAIGFKVYGVRPASFAERLCLQNGDVVTRVHVDGRGYDVASPERGLAMLASVREATRVDVELRRRGEPTRLSYAIE